MNNERFKGILNLEGPDRYLHFVKSVVDRDEAWGLHEDGWALSALDDGTQAFPLWPEREFAESCAGEEWAGYTPEAIPLSDLIGELVPKLLRDDICIAVFPTPGDKGVIPDTTELLSDPENEEQRYV